MRALLRSTPAYVKPLQAKGTKGTKGHEGH
jgi:hypothetical protein